MSFKDSFTGSEVPELVQDAERIKTINRQQKELITSLLFLISD